MSGKVGLAFILIAFILGSVFGCLFFGELSQRLKSGTASPTEVCIFCEGQQAYGRTAPKISKDRMPDLPLRPGAKIVEFDYDVNEGQDVRLVIQTNPGDICTLRYLAPNQTELALEQPYQAAGEDGFCQWTWNVEPGTAIPDNNRGTVIYWANGKLDYLYFTISPKIGFQE